MVSKTSSDKLFDLVIYILLAIIGLVSFVPIMTVLSASVTPYGEVLKHGGLVLFPKSVTFVAYKELWNYPRMLSAFKISAFITVVGTAINLVLTIMTAYPLSKDYLPGRRVLLVAVVFTMYFYAGIIPRYWIVKTTGLINTVWAMIVPGVISTYNLMVLMGFFRSLPRELFEAARIDGAGEFWILYKIATPLAKPAIAVIGLLFGIAQWNTFFRALFFVPNRDLWPIQPVVREVLLMTRMTIPDPTVTVPTVTMQMATIVFASFPVLLVYPFIQRYFTRGLLLGAIKG